MGRYWRIIPVFFFTVLGVNVLQFTYTLLDRGHSKVASFSELQCGAPVARPNDTAWHAETAHVLAFLTQRAMATSVEWLHRTTEENKTEEGYCGEDLKNTVGFFVLPVKDKDITPAWLQEQYPSVRVGGVWSPEPVCRPLHRLLVIVPFRDRESHLWILLGHLHRVLQRQQLQYRILVVEQCGSDVFNKGRIMNAAFIEGLKMGEYDCVVFHDVDMIPETDHNPYRCYEMPRHLSAGVDKFKYKLPYKFLIGGVLNIRINQYILANGYSNEFWAWGGEDDDFYYRTMRHNLRVSRPVPSIGRYRMIKHKQRDMLPLNTRTRLINHGKQRDDKEGLNSVRYVVRATHTQPLYTHLWVEIDPAPQWVRDCCMHD